jgi:meso-butanediol dehydrogenase/(S,S)-butanediol dehydrogenase/diacetyl reductase
MSSEVIPVQADQRFTGKVVVITGAARGIGRGVASRFLLAGARVVLCDLSAAVEETATILDPTGQSVLPIRADVSRPEDVASLFERAVGHWGGIDVLVNNAGLITISKLAELSFQDWQQVLAVNTTGAFLCAQAAAAAMRQGGRPGRILNAASGQARQGFIYTPHYAASKFGVIGLTQSLAKELAPDGITVNAYCPGIVDTEMWAYNDRAWGGLLGDYAPGELMAQWVADIPLGRAGTTDDIANLLLFLASADAAYITGQAINVDGGMFMN